MTARPYPLQPLLDLGLTQRLAGVSGQTWKAYNEHGTLTPTQADRMAARLGMHPSNVWPDIYEREPIERRNAYKRAWTKTPAGRASMRAAKKRWRETSGGYAHAQDRRRSAAWREANRERKREHDRAYYERTKEQQKQRRRERYQANRETELARQRAYDQKRRKAA